MKPDREEGANLESLEQLISPTAYLSPHSDIVALMVMEHQTQMHNAITAASYDWKDENNHQRMRTSNLPCDVRF